MRARLDAVMAELDRRAEKLAREGVPKMIAPMLLTACLCGCGGDDLGQPGPSAYGAPCEPNCTGVAGSGGEGGTETHTGGAGGIGNQGGGGTGGAAGHGGASAGGSGGS